VNKKSIFNDFNQFFECPTKDTLRDLITNCPGETDRWDFKEAWPSYSSLARHVLAIANSGGGVIIIGVKQENDGTFISVGLDKLRDKADVSNGLSKFFPSSLDYDILDFFFKNDSEYKDLIGKFFQVFLINSDQKKIPYQAKVDGEDVHANVIYIRRGTKSTQANSDELERLINTRIESGYSSRSVLELEEHLEQLKILYSKVPKFEYRYMFENTATMIQTMSMKPNSLYPEESYEQFVADLIPRKKRRIEKVLELK